MILTGNNLDILRTLPDQSAHTCVTSPPYWGLRDYGVDGQIGLEETPEAYVERLVAVFREVKRVLRDDGTLWLNLGDSFAANGTPGKSNLAKLGERFSGGGHKRDEVAKPKKTVPQGLKPKDLIGIPWRVAFALQADGWYLRSDIIWHKPNAMPESVRDRPTKAHEYIFLLAKSERYYYDNAAVKEPIAESSKKRISQPTFGTQTGGLKDYGNGINPNRSMRKAVENFAKNNDGTRNRRTVWSVATKPFKGAHFATFPPELIEPCVLAGCPEGGTVLDPFFGAGTTGLVAQQNGRHYIGIELNPEYAEIAKQRME